MHRLRLHRRTDRQRVAKHLDGGGGTDFLVGGLGNDIYVVDNAGDSVVEAGGQGIDEVRASVSYTLAAGADVETLRTTNDNGTAAINLTGNAAGNQIIGNNGDNSSTAAAAATSWSAAAATTSTSSTTPTTRSPRTAARASTRCAPA